MAKVCSVFGDGDRDIIAEETAVTDKGMFGINIHRANPSAVSRLIDKWSAGCQVLNNPSQFNMLIEKCYDSKLPAFTYTLLNEF